ncbi:MAG: alpha-ketoglutarate-dependent 2,4-dichlorophenoxyacetate dioxygenase [Gammaproteobacteria bacterium]|jgi:alpha-ketoglutarate-dependent 2,4-dichlorophenoxyacetate dioxygenase
MSNLQVEPLHDDFGARVTGVDLTAPLDPVTVDGIRRAADEYSLLLFPDQDMNDEAQLALTRALGEPEPNHVKFGANGVVDYFGSVGNVIDAQNKRGNDDPATRYQKGNNLWHTDSSFRLVPAQFSINHSYEAPDEGGETEFISQRSAYDRLDEETRETIDPLHVLHDYVFSRAQVAPVDANHAASLPPIEHKLVRTNPGNGRKNFYVGSHARSIIGWGGIESRNLIDRLLADAACPGNVYTHRWKVGDTVLWDNRCLLHRGAGFDADKWRRLMRQTRVSGLGPTLGEV